MPKVKKKGDDPKKDAENILKGIVRNKNRIQTVGYNCIISDVKGRVTNGIATNGSIIGRYQPSTKKARKRVNRQIVKVDLQMSNTAIDSLKAGQNGDNVVLGFTNVKEPKISLKGGVLRTHGSTNYGTGENMANQEKHFGKEIWAPNKKELKKSDKCVQTQIDIITKRALR